MRIRNIILLLFGLCLIFATLFAWNYWRTRDWVEIWIYDRLHPQGYIQTEAEIDAVLESLEKVSFSNLPKSYLEETRSEEQPFRRMLYKKSYYKIKGRDIYRKIIGHHRIRDFLPKDAHYSRHLRSMREEDELYLLLDKRLLYKFLALKKELKSQGYNPDAYSLRSVYRHPVHNDKVGGASRSKHILGEALDMGIRDINKDGRANQTDKKIVLKILDEKIIGNRGGIGLYPNTMSVHFDVRGTRARWNTH